MDNSKSRILYHIGFWIAYVLFKSYLNLDYMDRRFPDDTFLLVAVKTVSIQLCLLLIKIPMVYSLFRILNRMMEGTYSIIRMGIYAFLVILVADILFILLDDHFIQPYFYGVSHPITLPIRSLVNGFFLMSFTVCLAVAIKFIRYSIHQREREAELTKQKLVTELKYLKAQTNPHFLFNTLNNIYGLARKKSDQTADVVMKLSKLLRFMLYESQKNFITLDQEIQVLEDYIELEKIRYTDQLTMNYQKQISLADWNIAPFMLLPFVENAFKHGVSESRFESKINIEIIEKNGVVSYKVENTKASVDKKGEDDGIKPLGLENIKKQLTMLYPQHTLRIQEDDQWYKIALEIDLTSNAKI